MSDGNFDELIAELREVAAAGGPTFVSDFERLLGRIEKRDDPTIIVKLAQLLDDKVEHDEAMFSLIHVIEQFPDRQYVTKLLDIAPDLCWRSPRWASIVFMRVLNNKAAKDELVGQLRYAPTEVKESVHSLMIRINERSPVFLSKTAAILAVSASDQGAVH